MKKFWQIAYTILKIAAFTCIIVAYGTLAYHEITTPKKKKVEINGWDAEREELSNTNVEYYSLKAGDVLYDSVYQHDTLYIYKDSLVKAFLYQPPKKR